MTFLSGTGYALVALGPGASIFLLAIVSKPFLILTLLTSTLAWLVCLLAIAGLWRAFLPLGASVWPPLLLLSSAVAVQEAARVLLFWRIYKKAESSLDYLAVKLSKPRLCYSEKIQIALAMGFGHGLAHSVFFCLSLLTPAMGPATFYLETCPRMPFFLVIALVSLAFLVIHTFSMVIAFSGYEHQHRNHQIFVPALHLVAAFLTMINMKHGGCVAGIPIVLACAGVTLAVCGRLVWSKTGH